MFKKIIIAIYNFFTKRREVAVEEKKGTDARQIPDSTAAPKPAESTIAPQASTHVNVYPGRLEDEEFVSTAPETIKPIPESIPELNEENNLRLKELFTNIDLQNTLEWKYIVIHHSATVDGKANDWEGIRKWHTGLSGDADPKSRNYNPYVKAPMRYIGYNFGIEKENEIVVYRIGRPLGTTGGHAKGFNGMEPERAAIGICVVGNGDIQALDSAELLMLVKLCRLLQKIYGIHKDKVIGHRETYPILKQAVQKTCPGKMFNVDAFREYLY